MTLDRRKFLKNMSQALLASSLIAVPGLSFASLPTDKRLVVIILRGGMDGLSAVAPMGDNNYKSIRGSLALENPLSLDGYFGLHPSLAPFHSFYKNNELSVFHAIASPYRERSHFDAQNLLENGTNTPNGAHDGWLNRVISSFPNHNGNTGIAIGHNIPLILHGKTPVASWAPSAIPFPSDDLLNKIERLYENDPIFHNALSQGISIHDIADMSSADMQGMKKKRKRHKKNDIKELLDATAKLLIEDKGARIATIDVNGWDTHIRQGSDKGQLAGHFKSLSTGLETLSKSLAPIWDKTAIMVVTEFGRTVAPNGTNGTDHGTATAAFLMGGAVKGGQIHTKWAGLHKNDLYQGRDLMPTSDIRQLFKSVLRDHMGLSYSDIERNIFPNSSKVQMYKNLFRRS